MKPGPASRHPVWLALGVAALAGATAFVLVAPAPTELPQAAGQRIYVPWHTSTRLTAVALTWREPEVAEIVTRRDSKTGTTFTRRLVDCRTHEFVLLGGGPTEAQARQATPGAAVRSPIVENTIPFHVAR